jgi:hypothetical protein
MSRNRLAQRDARPRHRREDARPGPCAGADARRVARGSAPSPVRRRAEDRLRRAFVLLLVTSYVALVIGWWPLVTRQDQLPAIPLVAIFVTAAAMAQPFCRVASTAGIHLEPGFHTYRAAGGESRIALLWSDAADRAFSPCDADGEWR